MRPVPTFDDLIKAFPQVGPIWAGVRWPDPAVSLEG